MLSDLSHTPLRCACQSLCITKTCLCTAEIDWPDARFRLIAHDGLFKLQFAGGFPFYLGYPCCSYIPLASTGTSAGYCSSLQQPELRAAHGTAKRPPHCQAQDLEPGKVPTSHPCTCTCMAWHGSRMALVLLLSLARLLFCLSIVVILRWSSEPSGWAASSDKTTSHRQGNAAERPAAGKSLESWSSLGHLARQKLSSPPSSHLSPQFCLFLACVNLHSFFLFSPPNTSC